MLHLDAQIDTHATADVQDVLYKDFLELSHNFGVFINCFRFNTVCNVQTEAIYIYKTIYIYIFVCVVYFVACTQY